tara:strand:+ start:98 stop:337 length:240 start_codon:yes stop_codon:yes gene_type:complete
MTNDNKYDYSKYYYDLQAKKQVPHIKPSPWITIKSIIYTVITIILLICGLLVLPLGLLIVAALVVYGVFKAVFTVQNNN